MAEDRPALLNRAVLHYIKRLAALPQNDEIKPIISDFAQKELTKNIDIMKELADYFANNKINTINDRMDRFRLPLCLALTCYVDDLETYKTEIQKNLKDAVPPLVNIDEELKKFIELKEIFCKPKQSSYF